MSEQVVWDNDRIRDVVPSEIDHGHYMTLHSARMLMQQVRDDERAPLLARIAELEQQLADLRNSGCYPTPDTSGGSLTIGGPIIAEWCTTEENEAWAHLQGDDNEAAN